MAIITRHIKYVFSDVVGFTANRTVQAQLAIVEEVNRAFKNAVGEMDTIFLPTGDGICAAIIEPTAPPDAHLKVALNVMQEIYNWSKTQQDNSRQCKLRFGINESVDCLLEDINGRQNIAGAGINQAQRLMAFADGNQIIVGRAAFDNLHVWDEYANSFNSFRAEAKHGTFIEAFQYVEPSLEYLNVQDPEVIRNRDPLDAELVVAMATSPFTAYPRLTHRAIDQWMRDKDARSDNIKHRLEQLEATAIADQALPWNEPQLASLFAETESAMMAYYRKEDEFLGHLRRLMPGPESRAYSADHLLQIARQRVLWLRSLVKDWFDPHENALKAPSVK